MPPEVTWLQLGSIATLYWTSKVLDPDMNRFSRIITAAPIGVLAGHGFWKTWMVLQGHVTLSSLSSGQLAVYALTMFAVLCVIGSLGLLIHRLITK